LYWEQALGGQGFVDFYLSEPLRAALEITRDGRGITDHLQRFLQPDKYQPMLDCGAVTQYAVVDIRSPSTEHTTQAQPRLQHANLYTVLVDQGFRSAKLFHGGDEPVTLTIKGNADAESFLQEAATAASNSA
jgi:hypothetical protein